MPSVPAASGPATGASGEPSVPAPVAAAPHAAHAPAVTRPSRLFGFLSARPWLAFMLLGASFALFGLASLNLVQMLAANFEFLTRYGIVAVREGGLIQLVELVVSGYAAAVFYLLFKLCEKALVDRLSAARPPKREP